MRRILKPLTELLAHAKNYLAAHIGWHVCTTSHDQSERGQDYRRNADLVELGVSAALKTNGGMKEANDYG